MEGRLFRLPPRVITAVCESALLRFAPSCRPGGEDTHVASRWRGGGSNPDLTPRANALWTRARVRVFVTVFSRDSRSVRACVRACVSISVTSSLPFAPRVSAAYGLISNRSIARATTDTLSPAKQSATVDDDTLSKKNSTHCSHPVNVRGNPNYRCSRAYQPSREYSVSSV